jgi:hypothetical protein
MEELRYLKEKVGEIEVKENMRGELVEDVLRLGNGNNMMGNNMSIGIMSKSFMNAKGGMNKSIMNKKDNYNKLSNNNTNGSRAFKQLKLS